eukprot:5994072-Pyramimonas_sp.AAC.1
MSAASKACAHRKSVAAEIEAAAPGSIWKSTRVSSKCYLRMRLQSRPGAGPALRDYRPRRTPLLASSRRGGV